MRPSPRPSLPQVYIVLEKYLPSSLPYLNVVLDKHLPNEENSWGLPNSEIATIDSHLSSSFLGLKS